MITKFETKVKKKMTILMALTVYISAPIYPSHRLFDNLFSTRPKGNRQRKYRRCCHVFMSSRF